MSRQGYYKQRQRRSQAGVEEGLVRNLVLNERRIQPRLGGRKLYFLLKRELEANGVRMGRDRFFKVLGRMELLVKPLPKAPRTTQSRHSLPRYENRFKDMELSGPNQAWVGDITYIRTLGGFLYLGLVMDAYSRKVVGYHLGRRMDAAETLRALRMALKELPAEARPVHHSDRGSQYCSHEYVGELLAHGLGVSMTEENHCAENAKAERINGILKQEYALGGTFRDERAAAGSVEEAVMLYNTRRPHTALGMRFPAEVHGWPGKPGVSVPPPGGRDGRELKSLKK